MRKTKRSPREIAIGIGALALCGMCGMIFNKGDKDKDASSTATATAVATADSPAATEPPSDATEPAPAATEPPAAATDAPPEPTAEPATEIPTDAAPVAPPATEAPTSEPVPLIQQQPAAQAGGIRAEAGTCPDSHPIKGNINEREDTRIYHMPGSQSYRQTKPEECFATEADAQAAGYKPRQ